MQNISNCRGLRLLVRVNIDVVFVTTEFTNPELLVILQSHYTEHIENTLARLALNDIACRDLIG